MESVKESKRMKFILTHLVFGFDTDAGKFNRPS